MERVRRVHQLPKVVEKAPRPYEMQAPTAYGEWAQADFGERWMRRSDGTAVKVYFFVLSLSRSRYKFVWLSRSPFTTALAVYAHELAFRYFNGVPRKIRYDQDRVLLRDENLGDLLLTSGFKALVRECGFQPVFCHKGDPESKGQVENVVKYVKHNFLRGRYMDDIEALNRLALDWLERTGNGSEHHGIRRVPAREFEQEQPCLMPYTGVPTAPRTGTVAHHVRKDNTVSYHGNYYTVPTGTYQGETTTVHLEEQEGCLLIYSSQTGKQIARHKLSEDKGRLVSDPSHKLDRQRSVSEYEQEVRRSLPPDEGVDRYLAELRARKPRHYRDNLRFLARMASEIGAEDISRAVELCAAAEVYNGHDLLAVANGLRLRRGTAAPPSATPPPVTVAHNVTASSLTPDKTDISTFNQFFR